MSRIIALSIISLVITCMGCASSPSNQTNSANNPSTNTSAQATNSEKISTGPQPEWINGESNDYPRMDYITSRTNAATPMEAASQAIANITRYFVIDTNEFGMTLEQAATASDYELNNTHLDETSLTVASPDIKRVLDKIKVVRQWFDSQSNTYHALAAIPRNTGRGYLEDQIKTMDLKTEEFMQVARNDLDPLTQAGYIARAWRCQQIRSKLQESMRIADLTARGINPIFDIKLLKQDAFNLLTTLQIEASGVTGETNAREIQSMIKDGLKTAGLRAVESNADYVLRGTLDPSIMGARNGWAVGHGELKLVLADKVTGEVRGTKIWEIEVPGLTEEHAIRRVYEKTVYKLKRDMGELLMEMAM